jgi:hypothetical protein
MSFFKKNYYYYYLANIAVWVFLQILLNLDQRLNLCNFFPKSNGGILGILTPLNLELTENFNRGVTLQTN